MDREGIMYVSEFFKKGKCLVPLPEPYFSDLQAVAQAKIPGCVVASQVGFIKEMLSDAIEITIEFEGRTLFYQNTISAFEQTRMREMVFEPGVGGIADLFEEGRSSEMGNENGETGNNT